VGANVWLDGVQAGVMGGDGLTLVAVAGGSHDIVVSKAGYEKFERKVSVAPGTTERLTVELRPIDQASVTEAAGDEASRRGKTELPATGEPANQGARVAAWALVGAGLVGIGLGAYSGYQVTVVNSNLDPYRRYPCAIGGGQNCSPDGKTQLEALDAKAQEYVKQQQDTGDNYAKLQWVGYGVGGALLVTSAVFFYHGYFTTPSSSAGTTRRSNLIVMPSVGPSSAGALAFLAW
jgi:hypothetical protein